MVAAGTVGSAEMMVDEDRYSRTTTTVSWLVCSAQFDVALLFNDSYESKSAGSIFLIGVSIFYWLPINPYKPIPMIYYVVVPCIAPTRHILVSELRHTDHCEREVD